MALQRDTRYPGRFATSSTAHPMGAFKNRSAPDANDGTYLEADWANDQSGFLERILAVAGATPNGNIDDATSSQVFDALMSVVYNLSGSFPIGMPFFWPSAKMPNELLPEWSNMEFLKWNGASFSASKYPKLALIIPSLTLVEARGEFPRIWDDGRGVDNGRSLLSSQAASGISLPLGSFDGYSGTDVENGEVGGYHPTYAVYKATVTQQSTGTTYRAVRPRNIALNFLIRAK